MQRPPPGAERPSLLDGRQLGETVAAIFVVAVMGNYPWELAQAPLYAGMASFRAMWGHCFLARLGDGLLILGIFATGWIALGQQMWFVHPGLQGYGVMLTTGLVIGGVIEWVAVHLMGRWMYTAQMPLVPGLAIGVVPVV